ncbi:MAG: ammonia-forming cytochrome c nitrite reductase subunit c552 [Cystobacterineae bacterium]|nr:ammonia-forming cytochrome c nitrite reductase subunit c552 [Cystobacterineae bacterium]
MAEQSSRAGLFTVVAVVAALAGGLGAFLVANIAGKKAEERAIFYNRVVTLTDKIEDPAIWGENYPKQYADYMKTSIMQPTKYGGSYAIDLPDKDRWDIGKKWPGHTDDRQKVSYSHIDKDPSLQRMWRGYAFSVDFREDRGHHYMLDDQTFTRRQEVVDQFGNCMNCHASAYVAFMDLGQGDIVEGFKKFNKLPYFEARDKVKHPITCIDCHNPENMKLRISRPGLMIGLANLKKSQGIENYDVNKQATPTEMRSYVCAQCHVEYYFNAEKELVFPWHRGLKPDNMMDHYDSPEVSFRDWFHAESNAPLLKAQHPEFELWSQGIHARSGVSCADCHMPYKREGAVKISDHWIRSPLLNLNRACQSCHKWSEEELKGRVEEIQDRTFALRNKAMQALMELIDGIMAAKLDGTSEQQLYDARYMQRRAQFFLDFVEAENSTGFHAPQEATRLLAEALDFARQGLLALKDPNFKGGFYVAKPDSNGLEFEKKPIPQGIQYQPGRNAPDAADAPPPPPPPPPPEVP